MFMCVFTMKTKPVENIRDDIDAPLWDLNSFSGRLRHFAWVTDYRQTIVPRRKFDESKEIIQKCRNGQCPPNLTDKELRYAKKLYESAFHPDSGDLQNVFGRMSFQMPGGVAITACMLHFYKTNSAVVLWQFINQSFNALVNYTNRNANSELTNNKMFFAYVTATSSAVGVALGAKRLFARSSSQLLQRFVPWIAVASANCVNIPLTRQNEILKGVELQDENGQILTTSKTAAVTGISQVVCARVIMATPGMLTIPVMMEALQKRSAYFRNTKSLHLPFQTGMLAVFLTFMVPIACAVFPQKCSISSKSLESASHDELLKRTNGNPPEKLFFNKGL